MGQKGKNKRTVVPKVHVGIIGGTSEKLQRPRSYRRPIKVAVPGGVSPLPETSPGSSSVQDQEKLPT